MEQGQVRPGNVLKVDCFLNHQLDVELLDKIGEEFYRIFKNDGINKILTIEASDKVLILDDFLANGKAMKGLLDVCAQAGATVGGIGICIEKGFQPGGDELRAAGYKLASLAIVDSMTDDQLTFREQ